MNHKRENTYDEMSEDVIKVMCAIHDHKLWNLTYEL